MCVKALWLDDITNISILWWISHHLSSNHCLMMCYAVNYGEDRAAFKWLVSDQGTLFNCLATHRPVIPAGWVDMVGSIAKNCSNVQVTAPKDAGFHPYTLYFACNILLSHSTI